MIDLEHENEKDGFADGVYNKIGEKVKSISKKATGVGDFKMHKKLGQGIKVLCTQEKKKFEDLVTNEPKTDLIVMHFGNGGEYDHAGLDKFLEPYGEREIHIFPGTSYGVLRFKKLDQAEKLIKDAVKLEDSIVVNSFEIMFKDDKMRHVFFFYSKLALEEFEKFQSVDFPNASRTLSIPGLTLLDEYITEEYEMEIVKYLDQLKWNPMNNRRVMHFGYEFIYGTNNIDPSKPINNFPEAFKPLMEKLNEEIVKKCGQQPFDQCTINDYAPGQGIPPHVDSHSPFEEVFVAISLLSGVVMSFRNQQLDQKHLFFPRRGLVVFQGEARYAWYHSIATRKLDKVEGKILFRNRRVSLTFRKAKQTPCQCLYPILCDSRGYDPNIMKKIFRQLEEKESSKKKGDATQEGEPEEFKFEENKFQGEEGKIKPSDIERKYVYNIYDKIAPHFSDTRYKPWPKVSEFLNSLEKGSFVADIGCGNGKYLGVNRDNLYMFGTDRSQNLVEICKTRDTDFQVFSADSLRLPIRSDSMDAAISIAVIHHFSTRELRIQAIKEIARTVRPGGKILIYVWAFEQDTGTKFDHQDVLIPWHLNFKYEDGDKIPDGEAESKEQIQPEETKKELIEKSDAKKTLESEAFVSEEKKAVVYKRYYHLFKHGELEDLIKSVDEVEIISAFYDHANWCVILRKKSR